MKAYHFCVILFKQYMLIQDQKFNTNACDNEILTTLQLPLLLN